MTQKFENMGGDDLKRAYNKTPIFKGGNYVYWKENMHVHLIFLDIHLWVAITDIPFIPKSKVDNCVKLPKDVSACVQHLNLVCWSGFMSYSE